MVNISHNGIILKGRLWRLMLWTSIKSVARQQNTEVGILQKVLHSLVKLNADSNKIGPVPKYFSFFIYFSTAVPACFAGNQTRTVGKIIDNSLSLRH